MNKTPGQQLHDDAILMAGFIMGLRETYPIPVKRAIERALDMPDPDHIPEVRKLVPEAKTIDIPTTETLKPHQPVPVYLPAATSAIENCAAPAADSHADDKDVVSISPQEKVTEREESGTKDPIIPELLPSGKKVRAPMSEEQRAKLSEAMKKRRAAGFDPQKVIKEQHSQPLAIIEKLPAPPRQDTPADTLIERHSGYIGTRKGGELKDTDWGDIQRMRYSGLPDERIAKSYGIDTDYLARFIKLQEAKEEHTLKNR